MIRPLAADEAEALEQGLAFAARIAKTETRPLTNKQVQALYDALLYDNIDDGDAIIALGLAFGEVVVRETGWQWQRVEDEFGSETCVAVPGKDFHFAPISMVQKRLARGETASLEDMKDWIVQRAQETVERIADRKAN